MEGLLFLADTLQAYQFRLFWPELLMMLQLPQRRAYRARMLVWIPYLFIPLLFSNSFSDEFFIVGSYNWSFIAWFAYSLAAMMFCQEMNLEQLICVGITSYSIQNLFANSKYFLLCYLERIPTGLSLALMLVLMAGIYFLFYRCLVRPWGVKMQLGLEVNKKILLIVAIAVMVVMNILNSYLYLTSSGTSEMARTMLLFAICSLLVVSLLSGIYDRSYSQYKQDVLAQLLSEQEKQRSLSQRTISMINMKCHDMKHQLLAMGLEGTGESPWTREALDFVEIYDSFFRTGNEYLDLVLTEKSLLCQSEKINFVCNADGAAIGFMTPTDVYSFFGNALDNAIECQRDYPEDLRSISVNIHRSGGGFVSIVIRNYSQRSPQFRNGIPQTSKRDGSLHGIGTESMRYIIQDLYGGNLILRQEGSAFIASALLSAQAHRKEL